jgi:hypothetical protein
MLLLLALLVAPGGRAAPGGAPGGAAAPRLRIEILGPGPSLGQTPDRVELFPRRRYLPPGPVAG